MHIVILSDDQLAAERLRSALAECGVACPVDRVRSLQEGPSVVRELGTKLDVAFVALGQDEAGLQLLEELCRQSTVRVVAVGSARDPQFILRVVHAGPTDYLDIEGDLTSDLTRALGRLTLPSAETGEGTLVSVVSHCGGSGCSLLAANLAIALAEQQGRVLLCDFNVRRSDLATLLNVKPQFSVNDITKDPGRIHQDVFEQALAPHVSGVQLLAAPSSLSDARPIPVQSVGEIVRLARRTFPMTVIDLEDFFHPEQFEALRRSDVVFFVMRLDYTALRNARRTLDYLERDNVDASRIRFVVNQFGRPRELTIGQAESVLGRTIDHIIPFDPKTAIAATNRGVPLAQIAPRARITRAVQELAEVLETPAVDVGG